MVEKVARAGEERWLDRFRRLGRAQDYTGAVAMLRAPVSPDLGDLLTRAREYVADALDAYEHSDGRALLNEIDAALTTEPEAQ